MRVKKLFVFATLFIAFFTFSCKSYKNFQVEDLPLKRISTFRLIKIIQERQLSYDYLSIGKFSANYKNGSENKSFNGNIRIQNDEVVFVSIAPLMGIEMFRFVLKEDSVGFIDRYKKNYYQGDYTLLNNALNFDLKLGLIENLLCGQLYSYYYKKSPDKELKHFKSRIENDRYIIETPDNRRFDEVYCSYSIDSDFHIRSGVMMDMENGYELRFTYSNYQKVSGKDFPFKIDIVIVNSKDTVELELVYKKVEEKESLSFPFKISSKYDLINIK